jgi:hypothetical protein
MVRPVEYTLSFRNKHDYDTTKIGITVPVGQLRLCLIEHDGELYVSKFDDE